MAVYEPVIGLEVHLQLSTKSKAFCADDASFGGAPNTHVSPISLGLPGTLPRLNERQVEYAIRLGLALGCQIAPSSLFDRKHYFYTDLPKGYQITQDARPICTGGALPIRVGGTWRQVRIHHIHMEEDAGKSIHDADPIATLVDLNRAGVPLLEIVTEPDLFSGEEVDAFMTAMRQLARYLGISDGNMQEGSMRCDVNISVREKGTATLGQRCEIKNLNSMRFARQAIDYEVRRQIAILESGGTIQKQTLHFDPDSGRTSPLRDKESAHDYRYFPDPDLPPVHVSQDMLDAARKAMPALPWELFDHFTEHCGLPEHDAEVLSAEPQPAYYFLALSKITPHHRTAANLLINKLQPLLTERGFDFESNPVQARTLAALVELIESDQVSASAAAQHLLPALLDRPHAEPARLAAEFNLLQVSDADFLERVAEEIIAAHPEEVAIFRKGKKGLIGFFMGALMKATKGKADPKVGREILLRKLNG